jgi:hypothetical protein
VARFGFDSVNCLVWLDALDDRSLGAGVLCATHADRLTPPRGWHVQDLRGPAPQLWADRPPTVAPTIADARSHAPRQGARHQHEARPAAEALPFETATPVVVSAVTTTELDRLLDARTPLLARAFDTARERRAPD